MSDSRQTTLTGQGAAPRTHGLRAETYGYLDCIAGRTRMQEFSIVPQQIQFRRSSFLASVAIIVLTLSTIALAGKGGNKGGGKDGGASLAGTVYFRTGLQYGTMNPNGGSKLPLPLFDAPGGVEKEPSRAPHGGHRWFIETRNVWGTYPDGAQRVELFAVRDDGDETLAVQLTNLPELEVGRSHDFYVRWSVDPVDPFDPQDDVIDGVVSWAARRWQDGQVVQAGIYAAAVAFDADGNITGLIGQPNAAAPLVELDLVEFHYDGLVDDPDITGFDWSPDGTQLVFATYFAGVHPIVVLDLLSDTTSGLTTGGWDPAWSPDNTSISFTSSDGIEKISPDGGRRLLIGNGHQKQGIKTAHSARWSPDGSHLVYEWFESTVSKHRTDVFRAAADGSNKQNLTSDLQSDTNLVAGWR